MRNQIASNKAIIIASIVFLAVIAVALLMGDISNMSTVGF